MRISVNLSAEMVERLDREAKKLGTSRGAMLTNWIGEKVKQLDTYNALAERMMSKETIETLCQIMVDAQAKSGKLPETFEQLLLDLGSEVKR